MTNRRRDVKPTGAGNPGNADLTKKPNPTKTPMYEAVNALRYQRQDMIRDLERTTERRLLCYVNGKAATIDRDHVVGFMELLHNADQNEPIDLLLHTSGGDVDAAEKLTVLLQTAVGDSELRVIVPDFAKSAGALMALGADAILMSDSSELGAIDPQFWSDDGHGHDICHSVLSYLDAFRQHSEALRSTPEDPVARLMLSKLDPTTVRHFEAIRDRTRNFAESQLKRKGRNFSQIAGALMDLRRWPSHGQMIGWQDLRELGLPIEYHDPQSCEWQGYWRLYCLLRLAVGDKQTLFECADASLVLDH